MSTASPLHAPPPPRSPTMTETKTDGNIIINVRLFCTKKPDLKYLTRFQCKMPWEVRGKTLRLKLNPEVDTVATLKKKIEEMTFNPKVKMILKIISKK